MTHGAKHLKFRCTACGACCHDFRVPLTDADLRRLVAATRVNDRLEFVEWLSPQEVDMSGEPETFVELPGGRKLLVLRQTETGCHWLDGKRCSVHEARPRSCRLYPWAVTLGRRGGVKALRLLHDFPACEATWDGHVPPQVLAEQKRLESRELEEYVSRVTAWNRSQLRRKRLNKPRQEAEVFLERLLVGPVPGQGR